MQKTKVMAEPGKQEILVTRTFDAPRALVFRAMTDPELVPRWWGPASYRTEVETLEARPGGRWRFIQHGAEGSFGFHGVYHAVDAPEGLVYTFEYEGVPGHVLLETIRFAEQDGRTIITDQLVFQSVGDRDGMVQAGMESGLSEGFERLDELLATMGRQA